MGSAGQWMLPTTATTHTQRFDSSSDHSADDTKTCDVYDPPSFESFCIGDPDADFAVDHAVIQYTCCDHDASWQCDDSSLSGSKIGGLCDYCADICRDTAASQLHTSSALDALDMRHFERLKPPKIQKYPIVTAGNSVTYRSFLRAMTPTTVHFHFFRCRYRSTLTNDLGCWSCPPVPH